MSKAVHFLLHKDFDEALKALQEFEKKEQHLMAKAATNLSFL